MAVESRREDDAAEDAMLAVLVELHRKQRQRAPGAERSSARDRIVEHFERRGQRLRGEALVTSELLQRLYRGGESLPPPRAQQEIVLEGPAGEYAAGRLRVTNRSEATARFSLVVGAPVEGDRPVDVRFEPGDGELAPGATTLVRVEVSLAGWRAEGRATLPVECRWREGSDRAWLVVVAQPRQPGTGGRP